MTVLSLGYYIAAIVGGLVLAGAMFWAGLRRMQLPDPPHLVDRNSQFE